MIIFVNVYTWCNTNAFTHRSVLSILSSHHTLEVLPTPLSPARTPNLFCSWEALSWSN